MRCIEVSFWRNAELTLHEINRQNSSPFQIELMVFLLALVRTGSL